MGKRKSCKNEELPLRRSKRVIKHPGPKGLPDDDIWINYVFLCLTSSQLILLGMTCKYFYNLVNWFFEFRAPVLNRRFQELGMRIQIEKELRASLLAPFTPSLLTYCKAVLGLKEVHVICGLVVHGDLSHFKRHGFKMEHYQQAAKCAVAHKRHDILRHLLNSSPVGSRQERIIARECVRRGNMIAFHMLQETFGFEMESDEAECCLDLAAEFGQLAMLDYIADVIREQIANRARTFENVTLSSFFTPDKMWLAVQSGNEDCVRFICDHGIETFTYEDLQEAYERGIEYDRMNMLVLLEETYHFAPDRTLYRIAARYGRANVILYLLSRGVERDDYACEEAARYNQLHCLKVLHRAGFSWDVYTLIAAIRRNRDIECLKYAIENGCSTVRDGFGNPRWLLQRVIALEHLEALKYCVEVMRLPLSLSEWVFACYNKSKRIKNYLKRMNCPMT